MEATGLGKIERMKEGRNKNHTYIELTLMIPMGQSTTTKKSEDEIRKIFRSDCPFNFRLEACEDELWQPKAEAGVDKKQGKLDVK